jgi:hypothetical protein
VVPPRDCALLPFALVSVAVPFVVGYGLMYWLVHPPLIIQAVLTGCIPLWWLW